ncbi:impact family protein-like protein [Hyaloscypha variabilis F]|uniref:Impact family protein-like protein n=1 Tax=Hyaloscypha variabilis (strain UAMH 11265 / GT02V1 / F) TaxID=1149755 RepID=A0A2J6QRK6_HYAVF|nr:impact family protein-like protein [Hyaloscypha variabilis F]
MNEDLHNEVEAINSIYGEGSLTATEEDGIFILRLPQHDSSLRLRFPEDYPSAPPAILGTQSSGEHTRKGEAAHVVNAFRSVLGRLFQPGEVCLFDVIEEVNNGIPDEDPSPLEDDEHDHHSVKYAINDSALANALPDVGQPPWTISDVVIELKSVFVARSAPVSSPDQAKQYLQHLLDSDKKVRSATHNITAWRIQGENGVTFQDCDDDGETAAGGRVLHLMQLMDLWNVMVVVTRWYGGHQLGPKRFSIINTVARDAFVKAGMVKEDSSTRKKGKR